MSEKERLEKERLVLKETLKKIEENKKQVKSSIFNNIKKEEFSKRKEAILENIKNVKVEDPISTLIKEDEEYIKENLKDSDIDENFLKTADKEELMETIDDIVKKTGYNPLTHEEVERVKMTVDLNVKVTDYFKLEKMVKRDISKSLNIPEDEIILSYIARGSIIAEFTLKNFQKFRENIKSDGNFANTNKKFKTEVLKSDIQEAKKLIKEYTKPLTINIKTSSDVSLFNEFKQNIPEFASICGNTSITQTTNNNGEKEYKIHASKRVKGKFINFLNQIQLYLESSNPQIKDIVLDTNICSTSNFNDRLVLKLFDFLYKKGKDYVLTTDFQGFNINTFNLERNRYLRNVNSPLVQQFLNALKICGLNLNNENDFNTILNYGLFTWHGTGSDIAIDSILQTNLDPARRSGQACGPGEYFGIEASTSINSYSGNTKNVILFFVLKAPNIFSTHGTFCYVVNNPLNKSSMYVIPILTVDLLNKQSTFEIKIEDDETYEIDKSKDEDDSFISTSKNYALNSSFQPTYQWEFKDDNGWIKYGIRDNNNFSIQGVLEDHYNRYLNSFEPANLKVNTIRINDNVLQEYEICIDNSKNINSQMKSVTYNWTMCQQNTKTRYVREVRRVLNN